MTFFVSELEKWLGGQSFISNEEVITRTEDYFADFPKSYFLDGIFKLGKYLDKCILLKGNYVEKTNLKICAFL